jgi:SNF2 family DNA or RNA helicase
VVICPLSPLQVELHNIFRRVVAVQEDVVGSGRKIGKQAIYSFNNLLMQLRKTCNHPYLVLEDVQTIPDDLYEKHLVESSGKLVVLEKLLLHLIGEGSKVSYQAFHYYYFYLVTVILFAF